ncbi:hypothetical protein D3C81_1681340 [compost metagenome]
MHHCSGAKLGEYLVQSRCIADICLIEVIARRAVHIGQRLQIAGIGELVEVGDLVICVLDQVADNCRSNEAGTAGDKNSHQSLLPMHGGHFYSM